MKKKVIVTSLLTVVLCISLIAGATFALFTSESVVNIAVTSGKVSVTATLDDNVKLTSLGQEQTGTFANGGTATVESGTLVLNNVTPGDRAEFRINVNNESTVSIKERVSFSSDGELFDQLLFGIKTDEAAEYTYYTEYSSAWQDHSDVIYVSVELPSYAGNAWQDQNCGINVSVEAVQANGASAEVGSATKMYVVENTTELADALAAFESGDVIVLYGNESEWVDVDVTFDGEKTLTLRGNKIGDLSINAPDGTINLYNDVTTISSVIVAGDSLHIYGNVGNGLTLTSGRAVVEAGASVATVKVAPAVEATVEIKKDANVNLIVTEPASGAVAKLTVEEGVSVPELNVNGEGETKLDNSGTIDSTTGEGELTAGKFDADSFLAAVAAGGEVKLASDITVSTVTVPEGVTVSIDLGGFTLTTTGTGVRNYGTIDSLTNGNIVAQGGYGIDNRAYIGLLNVNVQSLTSDAIRNGTSTLQGDVYVSTEGVIDEIAGGEYFGHPDTYGTSTTGSCGLYNGSKAVVNLISGGHFRGSSVAFRDYNNAPGIKSVTGGFFDCPYMDANDRTFCDNTTIGNVYYNYAPASVSGGTWYNVGTKIDSKIADGYELTQGAVCEMTSYKTYVRYDSETNTPAHWVDDAEGKVYYYYTVETAPKAVNSVEDFGEKYVNTSTGDELVGYLCYGGKFRLQDNITVENALYFYADTVIDLNGKTITKDFGGTFCAIGQDITVTFINGNIVVPESAKQGVTNYGDFWYQKNFYSYDQVVTLNFEDVTVTIFESDEFAAFKGYIPVTGGALTVNINGAKVVGKMFQDFDNAVTVNYTDCTLNGVAYEG